ASEATGSVLRKPTSSGNWSWDGGTAITVTAGGDTDNILPRPRGPASAIMQAKNNAPPPNPHARHPKALPPHNPPRRATPPPPCAPPRRRAAPAGNANVPVVAAGDTLSKIAHRYHKSVNEIAKANNIQPTATLNVGDRLTIPGAQAPAVKASAPAVAAPAKPV